MKFWDATFAVLGFRSIPTTVLLVLVYVAVFTTVLVTDELPDVPKNQGGLNISQAYADLYQVSINLFHQLIGNLTPFRSLLVLTHIIHIRMNWSTHTFFLAFKALPLIIHMSM